VAYIRFVIAHLHPQSGAPRGIFSALYALERDGELADSELAWFREEEAWFEKHLKRPTRLAKARSPNAQAAAVSWFKDSAVEHVRRMHALAALLHARDIPVDILRTDRPGYIVYEDEFQVTAEPF
jgi:hypothetical protein